MPKGYKTISLKEHIHAKLQDLADRTNRTVPELLEHLAIVHKTTLEQILHLRPAPVGAKTDE